MRFVFFLLFIVLTLHLVKSESTSKKIVKSTSKKRLKTFEINLDEDPSLRWNEVATHFKTEAKLLLATLKPLIGGEIANKMVSAVNTSISQEYREEMEGIASVIDVAYEEVLLANVYYEVSGIGKNVSLFERACTSIVAQNTNGSVFLARNQDYPPPFELVEFHAVFKRNDEIVFQGRVLSSFLSFRSRNNNVNQVLDLREQSDWQLVWVHHFQFQSMPEVMIRKEQRMESMRH